MHSRQHRDPDRQRRQPTRTPGPTHGLTALQGLLGNTAVSRMLAGPVVQRAPSGNQGTGTAVQSTDALRAYVTDWLDKTATWHRRSTQLRAIDTTIGTWQAGGAATPGDLNANQIQLQAIQAAVQAWRASKTGSSAREEFVDGLATRVTAALAEVAGRQRQRQQQQAELAKYAQIDPRLRPFAVRTRRVDPLDPNNELHQAFAADRDTTGTLTGASLAALDQIAGGQLGLRLAIVGGVTPSGVTAAEVQQIMADHRNQVTGQTIYPELRSYLDTMGAQPTLTAEHSSAATGVVVTRDVGQTRLTVHWDSTDSQRDQRLGSLIAAVTRVQQQGYAVPPLTAYFPKYGRTLVVSATGVRETGQKISRAEYIPPNALVASPELLDNPLDSTLGGQYRYLSTALDPTGAGTMVHELGHFLHRHQNPELFHDLTLTSFARGKSAVAETVSAYAAQNPREFIAEVFLGLVYGRSYSPDVMEMYDGLGGPSPAQAPTVP